MLALETIIVGLKSLKKLGGAGLFLLGIVDSSFVPIPGGLDILTIIFAASDRPFWPYYALMATSGSVLGGYLTYRVGRRGGKEMLEQRFPKKKLEYVDRVVHRWGFGTILASALAPPPFPAVAFMAGAGALNYPAGKYIIALTIARAIRFTIVAYLSSVYGRHFLALLGALRENFMMVLIGLAAIAAFGILAYLLWRRPGIHARIFSRVSRKSGKLARP